MSTIPEETVSHLDKLSDDLGKMVNSEFVELEITIHVDNKVFHAHRFILEARSSVLAEMIKKSSEITLSEDPRLVESILYYIYTGDLILNPTDGWKMYKLAQKLNLHDLPTEIVNLTLDNWKPDEIFQVYFMSLDPKDPLLQKVKINIEDNFDAFVTWTLKQETCKLTESNWIDFLSNWDLSCDEENIIGLLISWNNQAPETNNLDKLLPLVRFGLVNAAKLGKGGEFEYLVKDQTGLNFKSIFPRSKRHGFMITDHPNDFVFSGPSVKKVGKNGWENGTIYGGGPLSRNSYVEYTVESINKNDKFGLVFGITSCLSEVQYDTCVGVGNNGDKYNLPSHIKGNNFGNAGDKFAFWMRNSEFVLYKNNMELGKVGISWSEKSSEKWYPVCFMYTQGTRVSYKITKK
jgi:hypothetical protein